MCHYTRLQTTITFVLLLIALVALLPLSGLNANGQDTSTENYRFVTKWGSQTNNGLLYAGKIAADASGNSYVIRGALDHTPINNGEVEHLMIVKYDPSGLPLIQFGQYGEGYGQLSSPAGLATDASGEHVYVSDQTGKILKFRSDGSFVKQWGSLGSGDGEFSQFVQGLATDREGNVYVADAGNGRIQKFSPDGQFITKWGSDGSEDGQFSFPYGLAVGPDGSIYVDDLGNRRIQKFTADGEFVLKWVPGTAPGIGDPIGIAVDPEGNVYVVPQSTGKVKKFTSDGQLILEFIGTTLEPADLYAPIDVAVDGHGNVYTALQNSGVEKFDKNGKHVSSIFSTKEGIGGFRSTIGIAVDPIGDVYVVDDADMRIQKFTGSGEFILQWQFANSPGTGVYDIAADSRGNIYLVWEGVKIYTAKGEYFSSLMDESGEEITGARAIDIDGGYIYVAGAYEIQKFAIGGVYLSEWKAGDTGEVSGNNVFIDDIAVDSEGRVYALGFFTNVIEVFTGDGEPIAQLNFTSDVPIINGQAANAYRIGIDRNDGLYVGFADGTIRKYDTNGNFIAQIASRGPRDGQVVFPTGIAFNEQSDLVYVADHGNSRVQVFGKQIEEMQGPSSSPSSVQMDLGLVWTLAAVAAAGLGGVFAIRHTNASRRNNNAVTS
jgi:DNA-binding beta-propeller fold protein YncE